MHTTSELAYLLVFSASCKLNLFNVSSKKQGYSAMTVGMPNQSRFFITELNKGKAQA